MAVDATGGSVYVTNRLGNTVSVIDAATNTVTSTWTGSGYLRRPSGIAISPTNGRIWVVDNTTPGEVTVLDAASNFVTTLSTGGDDPLGIAIDANTAVITNFFSNDAAVISLSGGGAASPSAGSRGAWHSTPPAPWPTVSGRGEGANSVSVIDIATRTVTATISTDRPSGVAVTPDGALLYVTNEVADTVSVFDTANNTLITTIAVGKSPGQVAINSAGTQAFVVNGQGTSILDPGTVSVIDIATNTVSRTIGVGLRPGGLAINPAGDRIYVADLNDDTVSVIGIAGFAGPVAPAATAATAAPAAGAARSAATAVPAASAVPAAAAATGCAIPERSPAPLPAQQDSMLTAPATKWPSTAARVPTEPTGRTAAPAVRAATPSPHRTAAPGHGAARGRLGG